MTNLVKEIFSPSPLELSNGKIVLQKKSVGPYVVIAVILAIFVSAWATGFSIIQMITRGKEFFVIIRKMLFPLDIRFFKNVRGPLFETIKMSVLGSVIGSVVAFPIAILSSSNINKNKTLLVILRIILSLLRTMPVLVYALIMTFILGIGPLAGTAAITIFTFSIVSKMLYEQIETVPLGAYEALESTGASKPKSFVAALLPQILPTFLSITLYNFEVNIRNSAILGFVGAGGLGLLIEESLGWGEYNRVGSILVALLITVLIIEGLSRSIRKRLT